jgi:hypothetical protein
MPTSELLLEMVHQLASSVRTNSLEAALRGRLLMAGLGPSRLGTIWHWLPDQVPVIAIEVLEVFPFSCRKAIGGSGRPFLRELIIPFGSSGFVAVFEIEDPRTVTILAVRHQREEDYH